VNGQSTVFVALAGDAFEPRPVATGRSIEGLIQITSGLKGDERVAARGSFILKSQLLRASMAEE